MAIAAVLVTSASYLHAQTITFDVSQGGGYIGTYGLNAQKLDFPIKLSDFGATQVTFSQPDTDGNGLFDIQGNDIPGAEQRYDQGFGGSLCDAYVE